MRPSLQHVPFIVPIEGSQRYEARAFSPGQWWGDRYISARVLARDSEEERLWRAKYDPHVHERKIAPSTRVWRMELQVPRFRCYLISRDRDELECSLALGKCLLNGAWPWEAVDAAAASLGFERWWWTQCHTRQVTPACHGVEAVREIQVEVSSASI